MKSVCLQDELLGLDEAGRATARTIMVQRLEEMLTEAKAGKLRGLVVLGLQQNGDALLGMVVDDGDSEETWNILRDAQKTLVQRAAERELEPLLSALGIDLRQKETKQ